MIIRYEDVIKFKQKCPRSLALERTPACYAGNEGSNPFGGTYVLLQKDKYTN